MIDVAVTVQVETWTEVRCIACVPLGWYSSHLLLRMHTIGKVEPLNVKLQLKCPRCKSLVEWKLGTPEFAVIAEGVKNQKRQTVAFE